ncbi:hypothetical protein SEVIR_1G284166v4 [Setaria viridis]
MFTICILLIHIFSHLDCAHTLKHRRVYSLPWEQSRDCLNH